MKTYEQHKAENEGLIRNTLMKCSSYDYLCKTFYQAGQQSVLDEVKTVIADIERMEQKNLELSKIAGVAKTMLYMKSKGLHLAAYRVKQILEKAKVKP